MPANRPTELMLVASFGGHLEELIEMRDAWSDRSRVYVVAGAELAGALADETVEIIPDCHDGQLGLILRSFLRVFSIVRSYRPLCIVTTGALPGLLAIVAGKLGGSPVIWIDSVANADEISKSGRWAMRLADVHLVQWPALADAINVAYAGSIL